MSLLAGISTYKDDVKWSLRASAESVGVECLKIDTLLEVGGVLLGGTVAKTGLSLLPGKESCEASLHPMEDVSACKS